MTKKELEDAYSFIDKAYNDYYMAKNNVQQGTVINRVQGYLQSRDELRILLNEGKAGGLFRYGHVEFDFEQCLRILKWEIDKV